MPKSLEYRVVKRGLILTFSFTALLWLILIVSWLGNFDLTEFGILPRTLPGTIGIITGPLIHEGVFHLMANTLPLVILGFGLLYFYYPIAIEVFLWIYLATGCWVWIVGRHAYHIGASGIIYGLMSFLLVGGLIRKNVRSLAVSMAVFVLYGGMIYGIFPVEPHVSWESHLMGLLAGAFVALFFRKQPIFVGEIKDNEPDENPDEKNDLPYYSETDHSSDDSLDLNYEYKPKDPKKGNK